MQELFSESSCWIWLNRAPEINCYGEFRESFPVVSDERIRLLISAEGQYAVFFNGEYIPSTQYPDYPFYKAVQCVELEGINTERSNELVIQVLYCGADSYVARKETPGVRFEVWQGEKIVCASGKATAARRMGGYQSGEVKNITPQLGAGVVYKNPRSYPWERAAAIEKDCRLVPKPIRELEPGGRREIRLLTQGVFTVHESGLHQYAGLAFREAHSIVKSPVQPDGGDKICFPSEDGVRLFADEGDGFYLILDLGEETTGYLDMDIVCPSAVRVDISYGEHLEDLRVRTDVGERHFTFQWEAPQERRRFIHYFHRVGARYLQLFIYGKEAVVYYAGIVPVNYPFSGEGEFHCGDHLHNQIFQTAKHTLRCCVHQHYEDCPWREQALYAFDSRNQMLFGYYAFGELEQPKASLRLLALSQREDGLLELCAPARTSINIPSFSLMFIVALEEYCRYSGDAAFGKEVLPVAERILDVFRGHVSDGLVWNFTEPCYWNFYEWRPLLDGVPIERKEALLPSAEAPLQLLLILALQRIRKIYKYLGRRTDELEREIRILEKGMEQFWNPEEEVYASFIRNGKQLQGAEFVQALALYTGIVPAGRQKRLREKLHKGGLVRASMATSVFVYEALLQEPEKYGIFVFEEVAKRWGRMLYHGATAFWETDDGADAFERAGSLCHAWSCVPIYLYGAYVLGVRPTEPGVWRKGAAVLSGISEAEGKLCSPEGILEIHKNEKEGIDMGFQAQWIHATRDLGSVCPVFRKDFDSGKPVRRAELYLTALGVYEVRLNGEKISDYVLAPGWTAYDKRLQYQHYDITPFIREKNSVTVTVGSGWFRSPIGQGDIERRTARPCGIWGELRLLYEDGTRETLPTDNSWLYSESRTRFSEIYDGECYDASFETENWDPVRTFSQTDEILIPQEGEEIREMERVAAKSVIKTPDGDTVVDFGQEVTGYVEFTVEAKGQEHIRIFHGEVLDRDGNFYNENYRNAKAEIHYICRSGVQTWHPSLTFFGFRYIRVEGFPGIVEPGQFTAIVVYSNIQKTGSLCCSSAKLNQLFSNIFWGQKGNFLDVPTDCPQRDERLGWTGDAQVFVKAASYNYDVERFFRKWLRDLAADQRENGAVGCVVPDYLPNIDASAAWGDAATICPWQIYLTYGKKEVLEEQFASMKSWVDYITAATTTPYLWTGGEHFGDWLALDAPPGGYKGASREDFIASAFYANSVNLVVKAGRVVGADITEYEELYQNIIKEFRRVYPAYGTQTEHVLAVQFGLSPNPQKTADELAEIIRRDGYRLKTGFVGTPYLLHVLSDYGHGEIAYRLLLREEYPSWLYSVNKGATTIWEHWDGIMEDGSFWDKIMNSYNHYAYGAVADWVYEKAAGIQTIEDEPGFARVRIAPVPDGSLEWLEASIQTKHGKIRSKWTNVGKRVRYEIETAVPAELVINGKKQQVGPGFYTLWS